MRAAAKHIKGPRADLANVRGAAEVRRMEVRGPGIASLAGIERFTSLVGLTLDKVEAPELDRLPALPGLQQLVIDYLTGPVDPGAIRELPELEMLQVFCSDRQSAEAFAQLDLGGLPKLDYVVLQYLGPEPYVHTRVDWLERAPALKLLHWSGFVFGDDETELVCAAGKRLAQFAFTPVSAAQKNRIMEAFPDVAISQDGDAGAVREIREVRPGEWEFGLMVADEWGTETTSIALSWLEHELERRDPALAARVSMVEDADLVFATAAKRSDLEALAVFSDALSPPPEDWDPE